MKGVLKIGLLFLALMGWAERGWTQAPAPVIHARLVPDSIAIGDRVRLEVDIDKDITQELFFPDFKGGKIGDYIEIARDYPVDTVSRNGRQLKLRKNYDLTTFQQGRIDLGNFPMLFLNKNSTDTLRSQEQLLLRVGTFEIDTTTQKIQDIKAPLKTPFLPGEINWTLVLGLIVLAQLATIAYFVMRNRRHRAKGKVGLQPSEPAHVLAIRALEALQHEKLWQNNRHKLYYTRLTDIVRDYIEARFGVNSRELTTDETLRAVVALLNEGARVRLHGLLSTADYVKFAKYQPEAADNEMSYQDAYAFVEETKSQPEDDTISSKEITPETDSSEKITPGTDQTTSK